MARMTAPESIGSESTYLEHTAANAGKHVMLVVDAHDGGRPTKEGVSPIDGFSAECEVIGGGSNNGKKFTLTLYGPKLTAKDGGKFAIQKQFAFLVATDVATPMQLGTSFDFDPLSSLGSVLVIDLALGEKSDSGKQYLDLAWSNVYHVDDPRAKMKFDDVQRAKIATIAAANRHTSDYFEKLVAPKQPAAKKEPAKALDLDDL